MLFRPKYCANWGEKIERTEWGPLTSRRFCAVCESEFKGQDLIPRAIVVVGFLAGVIGVGAYMRSGSEPQPATAFRQPVKAAVQPEKSPAAVTNAASIPPASEQPAAPATKLPPQAMSLAAVPKVEAEDVYICGAETKKGTPCSRRVKGNTRCYQHKGMPAMLPADKLKVG